MARPEPPSNAVESAPRSLDRASGDPRSNGAGATSEPSLAELFALGAAPAAPASIDIEALPQTRPFDNPNSISAFGAVRGFLDTRVTLAFLLQASLAVVVAHFLLFNLSVVRGSSMNPGIHDGDRILIDHWAYVFGDVHRGDVVVLKYPLDPTVDYIKRVIGLPGDEVTLEGGHVWVNGVELPEPYVSEEDQLARLSVRVKPAHFFVLGDNRPRSSDSRDFGQVPCEYVRGKVEVRLWPPARIGAVR